MKRFEADMYKTELRLPSLILSGCFLQREGVLCLACLAGLVLFDRFFRTFFIIQFSIIFFRR